MGIATLGRDSVTVPVAASVLLSLKDYAGIEFTVTGEDTFTLQSGVSYDDGSPADLATITDYWANASNAGADKYTDATQAAAATLVNAGDTTKVFYVDAADLPSGALYVQVVPTDAGTVIARLVNPLVGRDPANLRAVSGSGS